MVMTHGIGRQTFISSDMQYITVQRIHDLFLGKECPHLKDKPKIFIFTFCRGDATDSRMQSDAVLEAPSDIACIYSATEGFASFRDAESGTMFIAALCKVFEEHAHNEDLDSLLKRFQRLYGARFTADIQFMGFTKKFFFNPVHRPLRVSQE